MKTKRQYRRFIRRLEVEFSSDEKHYRGISSNFSLGGLFVRTSHAFAPGTLVDLKVHLPDGGTSDLKGRVKMAFKTPVVSLKNGMGIEILESDPTFVDFMKSLSKEDPLAAEESAGGMHLNERDPAHDAAPHSQDFSIVRCSACGARNRIRKLKMSQAMRCGKCAASLLPPV